MASPTRPPAARVLSERRGSVRILTLNRPDKLNAADLGLQRQLVECWQELEEDDGTRAVVLTGAGRAFCAGGDVALLQEVVGGNGPVREELSRLHRALLRGMLTVPVPIVAAVHGPAVGFGAELVALCDLVVIGRDSFLSDPHVRYGLPASPGCQLVWPLLTSRAVAKELLLSGRRVGAEEALRLGLVNRVTPPGDDLAVALELAEELAALPATGVASVKRAFNRPLLQDTVRHEEHAAW
jgi:enoyl-CoA hydratase